MTQALATLRNSGALVVLVVTYVVFSIAAPSFFGVQNLLDIIHVISPMMIVATGMALVVMSGKLDISVGSIAYVASALFALIMRNGSLSFPAAVAISIVAGLALGCVNAAIVVGLRVNSLIATLGTMIAFRGLGLFMTDGGLVVLPEPIKALGNLAIGPLYVDTIVALIILLAVQFLHRRTTFGRQLTAIGNNEDVARRIGIPVDRRTVATLLHLWRIRGDCRRHLHVAGRGEHRQDRRRHGVHRRRRGRGWRHLVVRRARKHTHVRHLGLFDLPDHP